jgi:DNA replication protein DnaC
MVDREWTARQERRLKYRIGRAKLREEACVEDINYRHPRGLDRSVMQRLVTCQWAKRHENIILTGKTGLGKTWLACALAHKACREGHTTLYVRVPRMLQDLYVAHADGSYPKVMDRLAKPEVLILDDFGLSVLGDLERRDLLEVIEERQNRRSTIMTSQMKIKHWHEVIGDPTIADAIMDRLVSSSHRIEMNGKSMRTRKDVETD